MPRGLTLLAGTFIYLDGAAHPLTESKSIVLKSSFPKMTRSDNVMTAYAGSKYALKAEVSAALKELKT